MSYISIKKIFSKRSIVHVENKTEASKIMRLREFGMVTGWKINIQTQSIAGNRLRGKKLSEM